MKHPTSVWWIIKIGSTLAMLYSCNKGSQDCAATPFLALSSPAS